MSDERAVILFESGQVIELRALKTRQGTKSGYYNDPHLLKATADQLSGECPGVYATLNPAKPALLARAANRVRDYAQITTSDTDILCRRWLFVDIDPRRPSGICSTDEEHDAALSLARQVRQWLKALGWPEPVLMDSGNGAYLLYRVDLPNDAASLSLVNDCLKALALSFDNEVSEIDTGTGNAARLFRLPGTMNCKGDSTSERPHRMAHIVECPATPQVVPVELLDLLAARLPHMPAAARLNANSMQAGGNFDLERWIEKHRLPVKKSDPWQGGRRWVLDPCPWNPKHTGGGAYLVQLASGAIAAGCHHHSCQSHDWHTLRALFDPPELRSDADRGAGNGVTIREGEPTDASPQLLWTPFPVEALPEPYTSYVRTVARARQCDPASVALPLLAALAGAIGNARTMRLGPDWYAPALLWTAIVSPSGSVKTPAFRAALAPLEEIDRRLRAEWQSENDAFQTARLSYEADLAEWRKMKKNDRGTPPEAPVEPPLPRCIMEDTTLQALAPVLRDNPRGVLLARDELSGWVRSFDQFTGATGADLARWLEIYRAAQLRVDRASTGHLYVPRAAVSICGTIQTDILPRVFGEEHQAAGLLARFLLAAPPEPVRLWDAIRTAQAPDVAGLAERFKALRALDLPAEGEPPRTLGLAPEAAALFGEWFTKHEALRKDTEPGPWRAALAKLEEMPGRLALVLALARSEKPVAVDAVDADTMQRAIVLADWFRSEGERAYTLLVETPEARADRELMEWMGRHPEGVTTRQVAQGMRRYRGTGGGDRAEVDLRRLVRAGLLVETERQGERGRAVAVFSPPSRQGVSTLSTSTDFPISQRENRKCVDVDAVDSPQDAYQPHAEETPYDLQEVRV